MLKNITLTGATQRADEKKIEELLEMEQRAVAGMERASDDFDLHFLEFEIARSLRQRLEAEISHD